MSPWESQKHIVYGDPIKLNLAPKRDFSLTLFGPRPLTVVKAELSTRNCSKVFSLLRLKLIVKSSEFRGLRKRQIVGC